MIESQAPLVLGVIHSLQPDHIVRVCMLRALVKYNYGVDAENNGCVSEGNP